MGKIKIETFIHWLLYLHSPQIINRPMSSVLIVCPDSEHLEYVADLRGAMGFSTTDVLFYRSSSSTIDIIPENPVNVVVIKLSERKCVINLSRLGDETFAIYADMIGKLCDFTGFPRNLRYFSLPRLTSEICQGLPAGLLTICARTIERDCILPENLENLMCMSPPDNLPGNLTHLICKECKNDLAIPNSVTHLCYERSSPSKFSANLEVLRIGDREYIDSHADIDLKSSCPNLRILIISNLSGYNGVLLRLKNNAPDSPDYFDRVFTGTSPIPTCHFSSPRIIISRNLPESLTELYISNTIILPIDYGLLPALKKLSCHYHADNDYPPSLECLSLNMSTESTLFDSSDECSDFSDKIINVNRLALPIITGELLELFCNGRVPEHLFLSAPNKDDLNYCGLPNYDMSRCDLSMIKSQLVIVECGVNVELRSADIICISRSHCRITGDYAEIMTENVRYNYLGTDEILDVFKHPLQVAYMTHPELFVNSRAKSARK